jgi:hypothetical protein
METTGKKVSDGASASLDRVRAAVRSYRLQKQLGLEITDRGHVDDLRRVLKAVL